MDRKIDDVIEMARTQRAVVIGLFVLATCGSLLRAQDKTHAPKPSPPQIESQIVILPESIIKVEWTHSLKLVNAPTNVTRLNPGQCIRIGIYSTGDNRDDYLRNTRLSFHVRFAGEERCTPRCVSFRV